MKANWIQQNEKERGEEKESDRWKQTEFNKMRKRGGKKKRVIDESKLNSTKWEREREEERKGGDEQKEPVLWPRLFSISGLD